MNKMNPQEVNQISTDLTIELSRAKVSFAGISTPLRKFSLLKSVPIDSLNESEFARSLDDVDLAETLALASFSKEINSLARAK